MCVVLPLTKPLELKIKTNRSKKYIFYLGHISPSSGWSITREFDKFVHIGGQILHLHNVGILVAVVSVGYDSNPDVWNVRQQFLHQFRQLLPHLRLKYPNCVCLIPFCQKLKKHWDTEEVVLRQMKTKPSRRVLCVYLLETRSHASRGVKWKHHFDISPSAVKRVDNCLQKYDFFVPVLFRDSHVTC